MLTHLKYAIRLRVCLVLACLAQFLSASQGTAQSDLDLVRLIASGDINQARQVFAAQDPSETEWIFFDGRVAKSEGAFDEAIRLFREALRREPEYIAAKRELAHTLLLVEEYQGAAHHFGDLLRTDPDLQQRAGYIHFLDEIDSRRPFSLSGGFAIISSSNINRGSSEDTFRPGVPGSPSFDITSQAKARTGVMLSLHGRHLWRAGKRDRLTLHWTASLRDFSHTDHDSYSLSSRLSYNHVRRFTQWSFGPSARMNWAVDDENRFTVGFNVALEHLVDQRRSLFFAGSAEHSDYLSSKDRDGPFYWAQFGVAQSVLKGSLSLGTRVSFHRPDVTHQQYDGLSAFAHFARSWPGGFHGGLGIEHGYRRYAADFPLAGEPREDDFVQVTVSARHDAIRIGGFSPTLSCSFGKTSSNIAFYVYDIAECSYGLTTRF